MSLRVCLQQIGERAHGRSLYFCQSVNLKDNKCGLTFGNSPDQTLGLVVPLILLYQFHSLLDIPGQRLFAQHMLPSFPSLPDKVRLFGDGQNEEHRINLLVCQDSLKAIVTIQELRGRCAYRGVFGMQGLSRRLGTRPDGMEDEGFESSKREESRDVGGLGENA